MKLSARNQLDATITEIKKGPINSEVVLDVGGQTMVSVITTTSLDNLGLNVGDKVKTLVKASNVMIMK